MPSSTAASVPLSGRVLLGRYRSVRELARGGMGVVYLGRVEGAQGFSKPVVIKTMLAPGTHAEERSRLFAREAHILARLQHPGIVAVIDFGQVDDSHVMVLEYVHGYNLAQWARYVTNARERIPIAHAVHVTLAVLDALAYAHGLTGPNGAPLGIVHRDISPGNILIDVQGHIKLTDFGIARAEDDDFKTQDGMFRGTLPYLPPETLHGDPVDGRGDEYACAVVLYNLLTGVHPFKGSGPANTIQRVLSHVPEPLHRLRRDVLPPLEKVVTKAMSKNPNDRYASVGEFADALRRVASWSERDAARDFAAQVAQDFTGELPEQLGLEPLTVRDAAWRDVKEDESHESFSVARSALEIHGVATQSDSPYNATTQSESPPDAPPRGDAPSTRLATPLPEISAAQRAEASAAVAAQSSRSWVWIALALAGAALVVSGLSLKSKSAPPPIIVEKQSVVEAPPEPAAAPPTKPSATAAAAPTETSVPTVSAAPPTKIESAAPKRTLASAFQQRRGAIQRCFDQNPNTAGDAQNISVRFDVDRAGKVSSATLSPASVAAQPLGGCILGVARSTEFGAQTEAVSFSIPIAARMVKR